MAGRLLVAYALGAMMANAEAANACATDPGHQCGTDKLSATAGDHLLLQIAKPGLSFAERTMEQDLCTYMPDVKKRCSKDGCKVLATNMRGRSCAQYCASRGVECVGAWEEVQDDCKVKKTLTCDDSSIPTSDLICQCAPPSEPMDSSEWVPVPAFFWNVHWECSLHAKGAHRSCKRRIGHRFVELARASSAQIVASIELSDTPSDPASLIGFGLNGWTQVNGPCPSGWGGDAAALAFAPEWRVQKADGGCLRHDGDTRAFAVARVEPPSPVKGCPSLCVVAIHAPHTTITKGKEQVKRVCGAAVEHCVVAMGDWNTPAHGVGRLWSDLIGGALPNTAVPDQRTCCWPESHHYGVFDHVATNVEGAVHESSTVHPYQLLEENPVKQHKAVSARLLLPKDSAAASLLVQTN